MKVTEITSFKKALQEPSVSLCLIIGKEKEDAIEAAYQRWGSIHKTFEAATFSAPLFLEEANTRPFLSPRVFLHLRDCDKLSRADQTSLMTYLKKNNPWVVLLLTAATSPSAELIAQIEKEGIVCRLADEKPWEKENRLSEWLMKEASQRKIILPLAIAKQMIKVIGASREQLRSELEKVILYVGDRKQIGLDDLKAVVCGNSQETLWNLSEAVFRLDARAALTIGHELLEEGDALFLLIGHLRMQMHQGLEILSNYRQGGVTQVSQVFPQWKGGWVQKKVSEVKNFGEKRLAKGLITLFDMEVLAKSQTADPRLFLDMLLVKLITEVP